MSEIHRIGLGASGKLMVSVYLRNHSNGECYYARYKVSNNKTANGQRYITESLQTNNLEFALEKARTRYAEITILESQNKTLRTDTVSIEIDKFYSEYKKGVDDGISTYSKNSLRHYQRGLVKYWKEYIGKIDLQKVDCDHILGYEAWRQKYNIELKKKLEEKKKPIHGNLKDRASIRTIELEINQFKLFLRWAVNKGKYSGNALTFTYKKLTKDNKRSAFTPQQWSKITGYMRRNDWLAVGRRGNDSRLQRYRLMLKAYVLFMKNTGLRVGEARNLRWSDVEFRHSEVETERLVRVKVLPAYSKVKRSSVIIGNEGAYNALWDFYQFRLNNKIKLNNEIVDDFTDSDDPIWCDIDGSVINEFREGFNNLIKGAGVELDASGNKLTVYSMRHTYITEQLRNGVQIYSIASNCNTSVAMIEKYYSDARPKDFEHALTLGYRRTASDPVNAPETKVKSIARKNTQKVLVKSKLSSKPVRK